MKTHDIIVIGASSGGLSALQNLVRGFSPDLAAAVFIVLHIDARSPNGVADILSRCTVLPTLTAINEEPIPFGQIRVARADFHLILENGLVRIAKGPKENRSRPAVDTLFRSAAVSFGPRVIGVVMTGHLDDGTAGLWAIKRAGGLAVIQDPSEAEHPDMPRNAQESVNIDHCVPLAALAPLLDYLTTTPSSEVPMINDEEHYVPGPVYVCPDCNGPLREIGTGNEKLVHFRCLVGHTVSIATLLASHAEAREAALWSALVALEHEATLAERASRLAWAKDKKDDALALKDEATVAQGQGQIIRELLRGHSPKAATS